MTLLAQTTSATIISFEAARAARHLPAVPAQMREPSYQVGRPVTVRGEAIRYGWIAGIAWCALTNRYSYTVQTPQGRIVCREATLCDHTASR